MKLDRNSHLAFVLLLFGTSEAFVAPGPRCRGPAPLFSAVEDQIQATTQEMNTLAEQCGDIKNPVAFLASEVEDIYLSSEHKRDTRSLNILLKAWGKAAHALQRQNQAHINTITPKTIPKVPVYTSRDAAQHLTKHLMDAESSYQNDPDNNQIVPNDESYNIAIDAWAKTGASDSTHEAEHLLREMIRNPRLEPSSISYNAVLDSHAHSSDPDSLERMDKIWQHMRTMADRGSTNMQPNVKTVHMILSACVRKVDRLKERDQKMACAQQALKILEDVKARGEPDMDPDVMAYSMVMDAFGKVGSIEAAWEAEYLMKELEQLYEQTGDFRKQPNVRTYTTLISAWARSKDRQAAKRAEQLLYEMKDLYDKRKEQGPSYLRNGEETTKPNVRTYTAVIQALSRSGYLDKSKRVLNLLMEMRELAKSDPECAPQVSTYNLAIDTCALTRGDGKNQLAALKIAFAILKTMELDETVKPNEYTYSHVFKAIAYLMPPGKERNQVSLATLNKAKLEGFVSKDVIKNLKKAMDTDDVHRALGSDDYEKLPGSWSKNVYN